MTGDQDKLSAAVSEAALLETRRYFFGRTATGLGGAALASLLRADGAGQLQASESAPALPALHHAPTARRVIWLFMADAPSQLDLYDYKPGLADFFDKDLPESVRNGQR
ncbi:MAG TPA: sulfatase, partial [Planctomycetaceae bacterium]|nr:sulfatase [Planctomycetaceae bacterium]